MSEDKQDLAEERTYWAEERTEWAEERTEWADQRTYLAQQRTFSGWLRTGLTSMAVGFGIAEFVEDVEPQWLISLVALLFMITGGVVVALAFVSYRKVSLKLKETSTPETSISTTWAGVVSAGLIVCALGGSIFVFL